MGEARTLRARDQFAHLNPDLPPLPVTYDEREASKKSGGTLVHALALFARSLESWNYNLDTSIPASTPTCAVSCARRNLRELFADIAGAYPPKPLAGLTPGQSYVLRVTRRRRK
jgi:hypothetical protein